MIENTNIYRVLYTSTAAGRRVYEMGERREAFSLWEVYDNPSRHKRLVYEKCVRDFYADKSARNFRICSHNVYGFTVAWDTSCIDPRTGEIDACRVVNTKDNLYLVIDV